ncbi:carboxylic acid reductase [uncultured Pantoea sp.]|uniref:carboxylic acid reductase n=1 Tax=uncultured Pantoea sp. TaxID=218084 RepID=UPI0025894C50|nr:carboxylic acid reductase [uncultured Pantoea sp.]
MRLAHVVSEVFEKYSERPAIGERDYEYHTDPLDDAVIMRLLPGYRTQTFKQLQDKVEAIAGEWHHNALYPLKEGDRVAVLAFTSSDYASVDLACIRLGAISVHLQTSFAHGQLEAILQETAPTIIASSMEYITTAVELARGTDSVRRVIAFDYHEKLDAHVNQVTSLNLQLKKNQALFFIETLNNIINAAAVLPAAPFPDDTCDDPLSMLIYTSGSTGTPKGAIYTEQLASGMWGGSWSKIFSDSIATTIHYMPMSHVAGHSSLKNNMARGGVSCFTSKSNLSSFFEDIALVKPTELSLIPRICEMIYQQYHSELIKRKLAGHDGEEIELTLKEEMRTVLLGGRITWAGCASAPLSKDLHAFIESILKIKLHNIYGSTEAGVIWVDNLLLIPPVSDYKLVDVPELGYFTTDFPYPRGELLIKTQSIIPGYYNRPALNAELFNEEGYYITGDIVEEIGYQRLQFLDRRKNIIKLSQGEFVAISNIEVIFSASPFIKQIFIHANSEWSSLLAVIVPTDDMSMKYAADNLALKRLLSESLRKIAKDHNLRPYEVPRDFVIEKVPFSQRNGLLSDHGKPLWTKLREHYRATLEALHKQLSDNEIDGLLNIYKAKNQQSTLETVIQIASNLVGATGGIKIEPSASFRDIGGDSLSAVNFSLTLEDVFNIKMPIDKIVGPVYSLNDIAQYIDSSPEHNSTRPDFSAIHGVTPTEIYASQLKLSAFIERPLLEQASHLRIKSKASRKILLTGASGYLGRFICLQLMEDLNKSGGELVCIVRGKDAQSARQRLENTFGAPDSALAEHFKALADKCLIVIAGDIVEPRFGLDEVSWEYLSEEIDTLYHVGALVNHVLPYNRLFDANVLGTTELIKLALSKHLKKFVFMSSIAVGAQTPVDEYTDIRTAIPYQNITSDYASGYAISKWAGEILLKEAHEAHGIPVTIFRSSMILAHSHYEGQLNMPDMFTRLIASIINTGIAPRSFYQPCEQHLPHYDGLPVDFTASSIVALASNNAEHYITYNLVNPHRDGISLDTVIDWLIEFGLNIDRVENYDDWITQFEMSMNSLSEEVKSQSFLPLLYGIKKPQQVIPGSIISSERFSQDINALLLTIPSITPELIKKYVFDLRQLGMISAL